MIVQDVVGMIYQGATARDLVEQMRESSDDSFDEPIPVFMEDVAERLDSDEGDVIRTTTPEVFIEDLIRVGYMRKLSVH